MFYSVCAMSTRLAAPLVARGIRAIYVDLRALIVQNVLEVAVQLILHGLHHLPRTGQGARGRHGGGRGGGYERGQGGQRREDADGSSMTAHQ